MIKIGIDDIRKMVMECISIIREQSDDMYTSACSYIFCMDGNGTWCILGGKRRRNMISGGNLYNPPMGFKEYGETAVQCAARECEEETGLSLPENMFKFINSEQWGEGKVGANFLVVLDGTTDQYQIGMGDGENSRFEWIPVEHIGDLQWAFNTDSTAMSIFTKYVGESEGLNESTNVKTLYHFTSLFSLREIAKTNGLLGANYLKSYWDDNSHISLTRHKGNFEGFAGASKKNVRIQLNVDKLNSRHDVIRIKPMEFYSPNRHGTGPIQGHEGEVKNASSKAYYQHPKSREWEKIGIEYHNQAEEGLQIPFDINRPFLKGIHKCIERVDILFEDYYNAIRDYRGYNSVLAEYDEINDSGFAKVVPIYVYADRAHFTLQDNHCMKLRDMISYLNKTYGSIKAIHSERLKQFLGDIKTLEENTNMKALYHFTLLSKFAQIACTNSLKSAGYCRYYWDNNYHISLTRHKGDLEGFANASYTRDAEIARIELNTEKLNSRHDVLNIKPMEFYSPNRERFDSVKGKKISGEESGKSRYQDKDYYYEKQKELKKNFGNVKGTPINRLEYQNQAEEGLQVPREAYVENLSRYVNRVDIYYPDLQMIFMDLDYFEDEIFMLQSIADSEFGKTVPIYLYTRRKYFILQDTNCQTLQSFIDRINRAKLNESIDEISKQTLQNAASAAYRKGKWGEPDDRVKKFRQAAVDKHREEDKFFMYGNRSYPEEEQEQYITDNNGNKLIIFDSDYHSLQDLYNGVKQGRLLIHCRKVDENDIPDMLYPEFGETVQDAYGCEFPEDMEKPELLFASDNFNWANNYPKNRSGYTNKRNGVFFIDAENFEKSIGDGYVQTIDGQIYLNYDLPITVETDDWFSEEPASVAGVMIIGNQ